MIKGKPLKKVIKDPRISVNKLAEYLESQNSSRRKKILMDAKYPDPFITTRYKDARIIVGDFLCGKIDKADVLRSIKTFEKGAIDAAKIPDNTYKVNDYTLSGEALESLLGVRIPKLGGATFLRYQERAKIVIIKGVSVSVNPDLIISNNIGGVANYGALKLSITRTTPLSKESQKIVGIMLYEYVKKHIINPAKGDVVNHKLCASFDVFKQQFEFCPPSMKGRLIQIQDACEEIASRWDSL